MSKTISYKGEKEKKGTIDNLVNILHMRARGPFTGVFKGKYFESPGEGEFTIEQEISKEEEFNKSGKLTLPIYYLVRDHYGSNTYKSGYFITGNGCNRTDVETFFPWEKYDSQKHPAKKHLIKHINKCLKNREKISEMNGKSTQEYWKKIFDERE